MENKKEESFNVIDINKFKSECSRLYNNIFDYSLVEFNSIDDIIKVSSPIVGIFETTVYDHLNKKLPIKVHIIVNMNLGEFVSITDCEGFMLNWDERINMKCILHGDFDSIYSSKYHCILCKKKNQIENMISKHGNILYNYDNINEYTYVNNKTHVDIYCNAKDNEGNEHGVFKQRPDNHFYLHQNCPKCVGGVKLDISDMQKRTHHKVLKYERGYVEMECVKHGIFRKHISKIQQDCSGCVQEMNMSLGESHLYKILTDMDIKFKHQMKFESCRNINCLPFDFYLTDLNICIEYDGEQHFREDAFGADKSDYLYRVKNDNIKTEWCLSNNIKLVRVKYTFDTYTKIKDYLLKEIGSTN